MAMVSSVVRGFVRNAFIGGFLALACVSLAGCPDDDGPFEEAGEEIDDAVDDAGDAINDVADEVEDEF